jgi:signal transduction histidine kinase
MAGSIVDGLLTFARSGAKPAPGARAGVRAAIADVVENAQPAADAKEIAIRIDPFDDAEVACTRGALDSILSNLIGNAIQNSPASSGCTVTIAARDRGDSMRVEVADTGDGLPPNVERAIFEPYYRARRGGGGLGLGLATVKRLVDAHGGTVGVRRNVERGCTFWFDLPKA